MAPLKQPLCLQSICKRHVASMLDLTCTQLYLKDGSTDNPECNEAIRDLQDFLLTRLNFGLFEELSNYEAKQNNQHHLILTPASMQLWWSRDPRIKMALFMHPLLRKFNVDSSKRGCLLDEIDEERFLLQHLPTLGNLVELSLNLCASDKLLVVVGATCTKLQSIEISSRIESDLQITAVRPTLAVSTVSRITDVGLLSLLSCRDLRRLSLNRMFSVTGSKSHFVSIDTLSTLVLNLPELRSINCPCMGQVLASKQPQTELKLIKFFETDPAFVDVERLQHVCPQVEHVVLGMPLTFPASEVEPQTDINAGKAILNGLSLSQWHISTLELVNFPLDASLSSFLTSKGKNISSMTLRPWPTLVSLQTLLDIGSCCPNLKILGLADVTFEPTPNRANLWSNRGQNIFSKLRNLELSGRQWNPSQVLPLLLNSAKQLENVVLRNMGTGHLGIFIDAFLISALEEHGFLQLGSLHLDHGCAITLPCVRRLISECPMMKRLGLWLHDDLLDSDIALLKDEIKQSNIDLRIETFETVYFSI